jgi:DNA mismatch repair protein MutL
MSTEPTSAGRIRILPPDVADKIAAGEVVERPASVVKELIENSIDAGARRVEVELEDAGIGLIAVVDDGEGMTPTDATLAFSRHATSKVATAEDLFAIRTLGFRGEALASIAAVSTTTLITRRGGDLSGTRVLVRAGRIAEAGEVGAPPGTRIEVVDLLGNTPARRKFLKTPATEVGHVSELVTRTALAFPQVAFSLRHGTRKLLDYPAVTDPAERVAQIMGRERAAGLLAFQGRSPAGSICGWLSSSHVSLPSNRQIFTYVNRRYVRDRLVSHALVAGYSTLLMHGRYPAAVAFIDVPPEEVDVNVHPAKSEVRFRRGGAVHDLITQSVKERLRHQNVAREAEAAASTPPAAATEQMHFRDPLARTPGGPLRLVPLSSPPRQAAVPFAPAGERFIANPAPAAAALERSAAPAIAPAPRVPAVEPMPADGFFAGLLVIGQAFEGYIVCESGDSLLIIDQHAAHERVMFERLRNAFAAGGVARQQLLLPVVVDVGPRAAAVIEERNEELRTLGFDIEPMGGGSVAVRAFPALLGDADATTLVRDLADELTEVGRSRQLAQAAEAVLARLACHSAVRVGQSLGGEQIRALLRSMDSIDFANNCPHGRPVFITLPRRDVERLFKRT